MSTRLLMRTLCLTLLVSSASASSEPASCDMSEAWCSPEASSQLGESLSLAQLRASKRITPGALTTLCPHKCYIKNVQSGRRLFAAEDFQAENGVGATSKAPAADQLWFIDSVGEDVYTLKNAASNRRMYAQAGQMGEDGIGAFEVLPIWDDQKWYIEGIGNSQFILKDLYSNRKLFAHPGKEGKNGLGATDSEDVTGDQKWEIVPVSTAPTEGMGVMRAWAVPLAWTYTPSPAEEPVLPFGPNSWSSVPGAAACAEEGTQSPIDISSSGAVHRDHEKASDLVLITEGDCEAPSYLLNEHAAELVYESPDCSKALGVTWLGHEYHLVQFNYHSPSEHTWDGGYFPMEVHHVHKDEGELSLVIAVMVRVAYEPAGIDVGPAAFLFDIVSNIPNPGDDKSNNRYEVQKLSDKWNPYRDFIPDLSQGFYMYSGSYTTPPCTSGVLWVFAPTFVTIPSSTLKTYRELINKNPINQLAQFGTILGDDDVTKLPPWNPMSHMTEWSYDLGCNNRPIQNLTGVNNPARVVALVLPQNNTPPAE